MVTLHPQPAMEHLHHRFVAADGSASDAMIALEATEVASTHKSRTLVPVRPAEPLAGAPDRSPIPLADNVTDGVAAVQASAGRARAAAGGAAERLVVRAQELLPRRQTVVPARDAGGREARDAAAGRDRRPRARHRRRRAVRRRSGRSAGRAVARTSRRSAPAKRRSRRAENDINQVFAPGVDLVEGDPNKATDAADRGLPAARDGPRRTGSRRRGSSRSGRRRSPGSTASTASSRSPPRRSSRSRTSETPFDIGDLILGPRRRAVRPRPRHEVRLPDRPREEDGVGRVPERDEGRRQDASGTRCSSPSARPGTCSSSTPRTSSGAGVRPTRPARGRRRSSGSRTPPSWGDDIRGIGTFLRDASAGLYNLYVIDPSEEQILAYSAAKDGSGFPADPSKRLAVARDMRAGRRPLHRRRHLHHRRRRDRPLRRRPGRGLDGDAARGRPPARAARVQPHHRRDREAPRDALRLRPAERPDRRDRQGARPVRASSTGSPALRTGWKDIRGMYVVLAGEDAPATLVWASKDGVFSSILEAVPDAAPRRRHRPVRPAPSGSAAPAASGGASAAP